MLLKNKYQEIRKGNVKNFRLSCFSLCHQGAKDLFKIKLPGVSLCLRAFVAISRKIKFGFKNYSGRKSFSGNINKYWDGDKRARILSNAPGFRQMRSVFKKSTRF